MIILLEVVLKDFSIRRKINQLCILLKFFHLPNEGEFMLPKGTEVILNINVSSGSSSESL